MYECNNDSQLFDFKGRDVIRGVSMMSSLGGMKQTIDKSAENNV